MNTYGLSSEEIHDAIIEFMKEHKDSRDQTVMLLDTVVNLLIEIRDRLAPPRSLGVHLSATEKEHD